METDAAGAAKLGDGPDRLQHADLIVGGHHAHQQRVVPQVLGELLEIHQPRGGHRQFRERKAVAAQVAQRIEHCLVFGAEAEQMAAVAPGLQLCFGQALECQVVGLGGAAGEHHRAGWHP